MKTYSHDAIRHMLDGATFRCDRCETDLAGHIWITLRDNGEVVACSNENKPLTSCGTGV